MSWFTNGSVKSCLLGECIHRIVLNVEKMRTYRLRNYCVFKYSLRVPCGGINYINIKRNTHTMYILKPLFSMSFGKYPTKTIFE